MEFRVLRGKSKNLYGGDEEIKLERDRKQEWVWFFCLNDDDDKNLRFRGDASSPLIFISI